MTRLLAGIAVLWLFVSCPASAKADGWDYDGAELARFAAEFEALTRTGGTISPTRRAARAAYFEGFVNGVAAANTGKRVFCTPDGTTARRTWAVVSKFLRKNPERWKEEPATLVEGALANVDLASIRRTPTLSSHEAGFDIDRCLVSD